MLRYALALTANLALAAATALAQGHPEPAQGTSTLRTDVQLVTLDVVVTDKNGQPIHGLKQSDFTVQENKKPQAIKGFEEHSGSTPATAEAPRPLPPGLFSNTPRVKRGSVDVLLVDTLNTPFLAQPYLRDQLVKFLATERPDHQVAIFLLTSRLSMLQDFTADPAILKKAVKSMGVRFSPLLNKELNDSDVHQESETLSDLAAANPSMAATALSIQSHLLDMNARQLSAQTQLRARTTMDALQQISHYIAGVPGRKNLLWFSGSFPVVVQRDIMTTGDPFAGFADLYQLFRHTIDILAQNQVAVYPIDARGVDVPPSMIPSENGFQGDIQRTRQVYGTTSATPRDDQFYVDQAAEHSTMNDLAAGTGGRAFYNTNALTTAMAQATNDGDNYYTLLYTPPPGIKPGEFRNLSVQTARPGVKLSYRKGYYAASRTEDTPAALGEKLSFAVGPDTADSSEIAIQVSPGTASDADSSKVIGLKYAGAQFHEYTLNLTIDLKGLHFDQGSDGKMHGTLLFATLIYAKNGKVVDSRQDRAVLSLDPDRYKMMVASGMHYHTFVALPLIDEGSVRVAVQDADTGRLGSIHLRNDQIRAVADTPKT